MQETMLSSSQIQSTMRNMSRRDNDGGIQLTAECEVVSPSHDICRRRPAVPSLVNSTDLSETCRMFRSGIQLKDHRHHARIYKECFTGKEAVDFIMTSGMSSSRTEAVKLGRRLMNDCCLFVSVSRVDHDFEDGPCLYRFQQSISPLNRHASFGATPPALSYTEMCLDEDGAVLTRKQIREKRIRLGFCPECPGEPIQLFHVHRNKLNPLSRTYQPITLEGESLGGQCLSCHPDLAPKTKRKKKKTKRKTKAATVEGEQHSSSRLQVGESANNEASLYPYSGPSPLLETVVETRGKKTDRASNHVDRNAFSMPPAEIAQSEQVVANATTHHYGRSGRQSDERLREPSQFFVQQQMAPSQKQVVQRRASAGSETPTSRTSFSSRRGRSMASASQQTSCLYVLNAQRSSERPQSRNSTTSHSVRSSNEEFRTSTTVEVTGRDSPGNNDDMRVGAFAYPPVDTEAQQAIDGVDGTNDQHEQHTPPLVHELKTLISGLMMSGNSDLVVDVIVNAMETHPNTLSIQEFCVATLFSMCKTSNGNRDKNMTSIMSSRAPEYIIRTMDHFLDWSQVQEDACRVLWSLSLNKANQSPLSNLGAVASIIRAVKEHELEDKVIQAAIGALRTLSRDRDVRDRIHELDGHLVVAHAMSMHLCTEVIQRDGIACLSNAAVDLQRQKVTVAPKEELDAIVRAMEAHPTSDVVVSAACFALKNYMFERKNIATLAKCIGVLDLLDNAAAFSQKQDCRRNAQAVLHHLDMAHAREQSLEASNSNATATKSCPNMGIEKALSILTDKNASENETSNALLCLQGLASQSEANRKRIVEARVTCIVQAMKRHRTNARVQEHGCLVMEALATGGRQYRWAIIASGGCSAIPDAIQRHDTNATVLCSAFRALKCLSVEFECWFELEKNRATRKIEEILSTHDDLAELQELGEEIRMNFSAHDT